MIPRLYNDTDDFTTNGYGFFSRCYKCEVTEEENSLTCVTEIRSDDRLINTVSPGMYIKAKPDHIHNPQLFKIKEVEITRSGAVITASHIKEDFFNQYTTGGSAIDYDEEKQEYIYYFKGTAKQVVDEILACIPIQNEFKIHVSGFDSTQKTLSRGFELSESLSDIFLSEEGIVELFGGEFEYDNFDVYYKKRRGSDSGKVIRYGNSISDYAQVINNDEVYTHVRPYGTITVDFLTKTVENVAYGNKIPTGAVARNDRILQVDVTDDLKRKIFKVTDEDYNWQTIVAEINSLGQKYVNRNRAKLSQPSVNIRVTYRSELDRLSNVGFSDTVTVSYGPLEMIHTANVTRTVYDSLLERYNELQIGDKKMTLSSFIRSSLRR